MWCARCQNDISACTCSDIEERLASALSGGMIALKYCKKCNLYYKRCKCEKPEWEVRHCPKGTED